MRVRYGNGTYAVDFNDGLELFVVGLVPSQRSIYFPMNKENAMMIHAPDTHGLNRSPDEHHNRRIGHIAISKKRRDRVSVWCATDGYVLGRW